MSFLAGERVVLAMLVGVALAFRVLLALSIPPWQSPDEPKHYEHVRMLVDKREQLWTERRLLNLRDASPTLESQLIASMAANHFWEYLGQQTPVPLASSFAEMWGGKGTLLHRPSLYYFLGAPVLLFLQGTNLEVQLLALRLISVILSTLTVAVTYFAARELAYEDRFIPTVSAAFVAALPMHAFIGGAVNSDNMVTFVGSVVIWRLAAGFRRGFTATRWLATVCALVLALASKRTAVGLAPTVLSAGLLGLVDWRKVPRLAVAAVCLFIAFLFAASMIGSDWLWHTDGLNSLRKMTTAYALNESDQVQRLFTLSPRSPEVQRLVMDHLGLLFRGFWGVFGWFNVSLSAELNLALAIVTAACAGGLSVWIGRRAVELFREPTERGIAQAKTVVVLGVAIGMMIALAEGERLAYMNPGEIPQGRTLFVAVAAIAVFYAMGLRALLPKRFLGTWAPCLAVVLSLVVLDIVVYVQYILPFFANRVFA